MKQLNERIAERIISIPDYPVNGVIFRDVMPVFRDAELFRDIIFAFAVSHKNDDVDVVAAVEARGFIFGGVLAAARLQLRSRPEGRKAPPRMRLRILRT